MKDKNRKDIFKRVRESGRSIDHKQTNTHITYPTRELQVPYFINEMYACHFLQITFFFYSIDFKRTLYTNIVHTHELINKGIKQKQKHNYEMWRNWVEKK